MAAVVITGAVELQRMTRDLMSEGKLGRKIFRKGVRAGAKVIAARVKATFPRLTGKAAQSAKVKAIKRSRGKIGVRVSVYADRPGGKGNAPYPMFLEIGVKRQPKGGRVRKAVRTVTVNGRSRKVTDDAGSKAYNALSWRIEPQHNVQKAFDSSAGQASAKIMETCVAELEKASLK